MYIFFWSDIFIAKSVPQKIENRLFKKINLYGNWHLYIVLMTLQNSIFYQPLFSNPFTPNRDLIQYLKEIFLVLLLQWFSSNWFQILIKRQNTTDALGLSVTRY